MNLNLRLLCQDLADVASGQSIVCRTWSLLTASQGLHPKPVIIQGIPQCLEWQCTVKTNAVITVHCSSKCSELPASYMGYDVRSAVLMMQSAQRPCCTNCTLFWSCWDQLFVAIEAQSDLSWFNFLFTPMVKFTYIYKHCCIYFIH